eukprot:CAMPEP_0197530274 /NCGR_PEP_ID=MMETSP1318-20131121/31307_1 /TAXON_ID=552666 /ORGANISM="Partenskyella glossopodia, Strain RCC365" /LENGTH=240 /DNA_ID=CAMNT_0043086019 /DNA_START=44 /DNA_END=763 /DNA_ORIENTATION=+
MHVTQDDVDQCFEFEELERFSSQLRRSILGADVDMFEQERQVFDNQHCRPISEMGNYVHALRTKLILRDPFSEDEESTRRVNFGSRYKKDKKRLPFMSVDEADEANEAAKVGMIQKRRTGRKRRMSLSNFVKAKKQREKEKKLKLEKQIELSRKSVAERKPVIETPSPAPNRTKGNADTNGGRYFNNDSKIVRNRHEFWSKNKLHSLKKNLVALLRRPRPKLGILHKRIEELQGDDFLKN